MAFSQQGSRAVCVLSASGAVSTVTLRQPSTLGGSVTYEVYHLHSATCMYICILYINRHGLVACFLCILMLTALWRSFINIKKYM